MQCVVFENSNEDTQRIVAHPDNLSYTLYQIANLV